MNDGTNDNGHTAADLARIDVLRTEMCDRASELITLLGGLASAGLTLIPSMVERECSRATGAQDAKEEDPDAPVHARRWIPQDGGDLA